LGHLLGFTFLGPPLCGKGTQANLLAEKLGFFVISPGDIFREAIDQNSDLGKKVRAMVLSGKLVPDKIVIDAITPLLEKPSCNKGFILDGFPRTMGQLKFMEGFGATKNRAITMVILLEIDWEEMVKRSKGRKRMDDRSIEILEARLNAYKTQTLPVISYYRKKSLLLEIDGVGPIPEVWQRLYLRIGKKFRNFFNEG